MARIMPYMVEELGTNVVPHEVHPPQEALFGNTCIFIHAPQYIGTATNKVLLM